MKTRNLITTLFLLVTLLFLYVYSQDIMQFVLKNVVYRDEVLDKEANEYYKEYDYNYVQITDNFYPKNRQDIKNIFYTALNKGFEDITFYCTKAYENCDEEANDIALDEDILSYVNNFVSTYNSYNKIYVNINSFGRINIGVKNIYNKEDISKISAKVDEVYNSLINDDMSDEEKIRTIHDYIINNTVYDEERADEVRNNALVDNIHSSNTAYGPLFTGKAICGGYTDAMALFLDKMGLQNIKVSSSNHIWNAVYINGEWRHLDLTWDDPVVVNGPETLTYNYFLISSDELKSKADSRHDFDEDVFSELMN